ncbi:MAG: glycosyltransferase [Ruminococcus sp.]
MKIVQINSTYGIGSTGKICRDISELLTDKGVENYTLYTIGNSDAPNAIKCSDRIYVKLQALKSRILGNYGFNSLHSTKKIISELDRIKPDVVHIHNIHSHDCNLEMLFDYFNSSRQKLIWTFHDCWAFTGYCPHFYMARCVKWENECNNCPLFRNYSFFADRSKILFEKKRELLHDLELTIVTPSEWLAGLVKKSFLKNYPVRVINNGIDLDVFKPTKNDFRSKYNIHSDKHIILGVAFDWSERKGLDVFVQLAKRLNPDKFQIVLVGTNNKTDKVLPQNIISVHRTQNQQELAGIYSEADLFVNPTREDNYPTVNMEAIACGTPVLTFNTGGSPEIIDEACGSIAEVDDIDTLENEIIRICEMKPYSSEMCLTKAKTFDKNVKYAELIDLILSGK